MDVTLERDGESGAAPSEAVHDAIVTAPGWSRVVVVIEDRPGRSSRPTEWACNTSVFKALAASLGVDILAVPAVSVARP